jgi:ribosomal protein S27E
VKKERLDLEVTVVGIHPYTTADGEPKTVVKCRTREGAELVTFTGGKHPLVEDIGKNVKVRGTVKDHNYRDGKAQTVLSRCVWS